MSMRMSQAGKAASLLALTITAFLGCRCHADDLVGVWQTEPKHWSASGHTNKVEALEMIEFFRDRSFKITEVTVAEGKRWTNVPYTGTYVMVGSNRASLKIIPHNVPPGATAPSHTVSCVIIGGELELPKLITSVAPEHQRYHRAK
jgi:hypothetical protein